MKANSNYVAISSLVIVKIFILALINPVFAGDTGYTIQANYPPYIEFYEDFNNGSANFLVSGTYSLSDGHLVFRGDPDITGSIYNFVSWNGGENPGGDLPQPENSNYFENFNVSVDTIWDGRSETWSFGLIVCATESQDGRDNVMFGINNSGAYAISKRINGEGDMVVAWTKSSLLNTGATQNKLSIKKIGPYYHFYINQIEVERRLIVGIHGGGAGLFSFHQVDVSYDNFSVTRITQSDLGQDGNSVLEDFDNGVGGFTESSKFGVFNNRFLFQSSGADSTYYNAWNGGFNPGGIGANPGNSNYFENFTVAVDTYWESGVNNYYGLRVCTKQNGDDTKDLIEFVMASECCYSIAKIDDDVFEILVDWTSSPYIGTSPAMDKLSIQKNGNHYHFFINDNEVESLTINDFTGGSIAVEISDHDNVSFDNFSIIVPGLPPIADAGLGQDVTEEEYVTLDGSNSSDDQGVFTYQWYQISGPPVELVNLNTGQPTFIAPEVGYDGVSMVFQVMITDNNRLHSTDICEVNVSCEDTKGDIDGNCEVDLTDVIISLQVLSGNMPSGVRSDYLSSNADADSNNKLGMAEAIYSLHTAADLE